MVLYICIFLLVISCLYFYWQLWICYSRFTWWKTIKTCDLAYEKLKLTQGNKIVYFIAGIPDICTLAKDVYSKYEESYLKLHNSVGKEIDHVDNFMQKIYTVEARMKGIGCKVVFATITTMSFVVWNNTRLSQRKTSCLMYNNEYDIMQARETKFLSSCY